jgi:hypothetical protein
VTRDDLRMYYVEALDACRAHPVMARAFLDARLVAVLEGLRGNAAAWAEVCTALERHELLSGPGAAPTPADRLGWRVEWDRGDGTVAWGGPMSEEDARQSARMLDLHYPGRRHRAAPVPPPGGPEGGG